VTDPLEISFDVACEVTHAFTTWTDRITTWWPADHTVSGEPDVKIVIEGRVAGRIFERTVTGVEHDWGEVTQWRPPTLLSYRWFLGATRDAATHVTVSFVRVADDVTRVQIEHRGWDELGQEAAARRDRNQAGWDAVLGHYRAALVEPS